MGSTMTETPITGLLDLEKELTCSICTEVLYQPLTLLDCLHTFCGSCLRDWFSFQATRANEGGENPFTCPSCRASVRETRPDAKVTTLLDMFIQANPAKGRTAQEKEDSAKKYKPGDNVIPKLATATPLDDEDRRMMEEVREMSLRDVGSRGPRSYERGTRHRIQSRERNDEGRQRRRRDGQDASGVPMSPADSRSQARRLGHQSSLRSLLSASDADSEEIEQEILRQIVEEGLLDGIDVNNLNASQEDELSERIAAAYRHRHRRHSPQSHHSQSESTRGPRGQTRRTSDQSTARRHHAVSSGSADRPTQSSYPPVSRPHLLEEYPTSRGHRRRTSSETRRRRSPVLDTPPARQEAARSATDLSSRPRRPESRETRPVEALGNHRRATDPRPRRLSEGVRQTTQPAPTTDPREGLPYIAPLRFNHSPAGSTNGPPIGVPDPSNTNQDEPATGVVRPTQLEAPNTVEGGSSRPSSSSSATARPRPVLYVEPSVACDRCEKTDIEYDLHENCTVCKDGKYNLCHRCYREGKGCLHWYGFGQSAWHRFQQQSSSTATLPHTLVGRRYKRPTPMSIQVPTTSDRGRMSTEDPATRLQSGAFCSSCSTFADDCFWKCDYCNHGEWGFCNRCVNQGKCCTHPLLPVAHVSTIQARDTHASAGIQSEASFAPLSSPRAVQSFPSNLSTSGLYRPLSFSTQCDKCKYPIQPSQTRLHCYECNNGDYDMCTSCYSKQTAMGKISRENGDRGWRRCLQGHRMILVGFEDTPAGQRRIIVKDLVGGHALKDEAGATPIAKQEWSWRDGLEKQTRTVSRQVGSNAEGGMAATMLPLLQKFPPNGGVGMVVTAIWAYLPKDGVVDELSFPKGAEIREVEDINGDWFWGCYAGATGLFPAEYTRVSDVVTM